MSRYLGVVFVALSSMTALAISPEDQQMVRNAQDKLQAIMQTGQATGPTVETLSAAMGALTPQPDEKNIQSGPLVQSMRELTDAYGAMQSQCDDAEVAMRTIQERMIELSHSSDEPKFYQANAERAKKTAASIHTAGKAAGKLKALGQEFIETVNQFSDQWAAAQAAHSQAALANVKRIASHGLAIGKKFNHAADELGDAIEGAGHAWSGR